MNKKNIISTKNIAIVGLLIAMSIVLTRLASIRIAIGGVEGIRIGFGKLPIVLGGFILGPVYGAFIGAIADIVGYIIQPIGPYMPHFSVISALNGFLPITILHLIGGEEDYQLFKMAVAIGISIFVNDLLFLPYSLHLLFGIPWNILIIPRLFSVPVTIVLYTYIAHVFKNRNVIQFKQNHQRFRSFF
ncbi:MAG: folate family ECF transporter S component [Atribacterota bacterium]|nr:folate family ECF transporter S component [Atribacterota bacterium]